MTKLDLKEGTSGPWTVEHFEITEEAAKSYNWGLLFSFQYSRKVKPGWYTRLAHEERGVVMSNTPAELMDLWDLEFQISDLERNGRPDATTRVHISGLGLGVATSMALDCNKVDHVTVVEVSKDVVYLVGNQLEEKYGDRLTIIHDDAMKYKPVKGSRFALVWHDIWDTIDFDNWEEYKFLHRRWGRYTDWQQSWGRTELKRQQRESYSYRW